MAYSIRNRPDRIPPDSREGGETSNLLATGRIWRYLSFSRASLDDGFVPSQGLRQAEVRETHLSPNVRDKQVFADT